ncbi:MAG: DUF2238 domain-containing protein [Isosphaeraceae bacterium]|nr:DUF2238 domain-containing protein [Isosphaeraceae bacterium]
MTQVAAPPRRGRWPTPAEWTVLGASLLYIAAAAVAALVVRNREFLLYIVVMLILVTVVVLVHLRVGFSLGLLWALSGWGLLHMAGGLVPVPATWPIEGRARVLYNLWLIPGRLKFDQAVHVYGFGVATWACWQALRAAAGVERPTAGLVVLCAAAGVGFGALNEVIEFVATRLVAETNVGGYENTGWDLVANLVGATAAGLLLWLRGRQGG